MTSWRPFWIICIFWQNTQGFTSGTRRIWNQHLDIDKKPSNKFVYVKKQGRCVCLDDVMAAILNNLHILTKYSWMVSRLGPGGFGISTSILTKSHQINLFMSKNKGDVFVYDVMAAILNNLHIVKNAQGLTSGTQRIWNQHLHIDQKPSKHVVYVEKQGGSSPILD